MAHPQVADEADRPKIWKTATNTLTENCRQLRRGGTPAPVLHDGKRKAFHHIIIFYTEPQTCSIFRWVVL
jgi:hypothetical protein